MPLELSSRQFTFSGTFSGTSFLVSPGVEHGFYTGDAIYYTAGLVSETFIDGQGSSATRLVRGTGLFADGFYFVKRIDGFTLNLQKSRDDIYNSKFVSLSEETTVSNSVIKPYELDGKDLVDQKLVREFSIPINDGTINKTKPGFTGMLVNGVELLNYKSKNTVNYGKIENIEVLRTWNKY